MLAAAEQTAARIGLDVGALRVQLLGGDGLHVAVAIGEEGPAARSAGRGGALVLSGG